MLCYSFLAEIEALLSAGTWVTPLVLVIASPEFGDKDSEGCKATCIGIVGKSALSQAERRSRLSFKRGYILILRLCFLLLGVALCAGASAQDQRDAMATAPPAVATCYQTASSIFSNKIWFNRWTHWPSDDVKADIEADIEGRKAILLCRQNQTLWCLVEEPGLWKGHGTISLDNVREFRGTFAGRSPSPTCHPSSALSVRFAPVDRPAARPAESSNHYEVGLLFLGDAGYPFWLLNDSNLNKCTISIESATCSRGTFFTEIMFRSQKLILGNPGSELIQPIVREGDNRHVGLWFGIFLPQSSAGIAKTYIGTAISPDNNFRNDILLFIEASEASLALKTKFGASTNCPVNSAGLWECKLDGRTALLARGPGGTIIGGMSSAGSKSQPAPILAGRFDQNLTEISGRSVSDQSRIAYYTADLTVVDFLAGGVGLATSQGLGHRVFEFRYIRGLTGVGRRTVSDDGNEVEMSGSPRQTFRFDNPRLAHAAVSTLEASTIRPSTPATETTPPGSEKVGPSFECGITSANHALSRIVCGNNELARLDLSYVIAFQALQQSLNVGGRTALRAEANAFVQTVIETCNLQKAGGMEKEPAPIVVGCVTRHFERQRQAMLQRTSGDALDEGNLEPEQALAIQHALKAKGFLPATAAIDGVFGPATRSAIVSWQRSTRMPETGYGSQSAFLQLTRLPGENSTSNVWKQVVIPRFGLSVDYPVSVFSSSVFSDNGDGVTFNNNTEGETLTVWGSYNSDESPYHNLCGRRGCEGETFRIDQKKLGVASGIQNGSIYYKKCLLADETRNQFHCFALTYPSSRKAEYDAITTRIADSLR